MKQPCGYTNISDAIVIESMGALFILNRLMMKELNEVAYQTIDRSRLFKLCDSMDETKHQSTTVAAVSHYNQYVRHPMRGYNKGPKAARGPWIRWAN